MDKTNAYVKTSLAGTSRAWIAKVKVRVVKEGEEGETELYKKTFSGVSMKHPKDRTKDKIGAELALGRALENAGKRLQKVAWGEVPAHFPSPNHPSMQPSAQLIVAPSSKKQKKRKGKWKRS